MKAVITTLVATIMIAGCSSSDEPAPDDVQYGRNAEGEIFPADRTLQRPEDGVVLADHTLLVGDQRHGLVRVQSDGSLRPFGDFASAGYVYQPPAQNAAPNGVTMEPNGTHLLVADVFSGAIYRVDIPNETTEKVYQHEFGVNTARRDSTGAIWFTQSTENAGANTEERLFEAVEYPTPDGALFRIAPHDENTGQPAPELKVSGLNFANGFVIDEERGALYLSETASDRVLGFTLDVDTGNISEQRVVASIAMPDNMELHGSGALWVASPVSTQIVAIDVASGDVQPVYRPENPHRDGIVEEWRRRGEAGEARLNLVGPELIGSMPGLPTGMIIDEQSDVFYVTGLGDAMVKVGAE